MSQTYNLGKVAITPRGAYSSTAQYTPLDILSYNGSSYLVLQNCMGITPPNATYYMVVASKGDTGSAGTSTTIAAGTVTMTPAGTSASVTNVGTNVNASFNFTLPNGNVIYTGTGITGTSTTPTVFSGSGVSNAGVGDIYFNTSTVAFYSCVYGGNASTATWTFLTYAVPDGTVTTSKIADSAITRNKIDDGAVGNDELDDGSVSVSKLGSDVSDVLDAKANVDGAYEQMTVGNAEQLVSTVGVSDSAPYVFRTTGGSADVGDRMNIKAVVGGTVAWNQLVPNANITFTSDNTDTRALNFYFRQGVSPYTSLYNKSDVQTGILSSIVSASFDGYIQMVHAGAVRNMYYVPRETISVRNGHKYLFSLNITGTDVSTVGGVTAKDIQIYDLTAMFGSTIADYVYTLESGTAGAGIAWLKKYGYFTKPYYPYTAASLESVKTSAHKTVGFNAYDNTTGKAKVVGGMMYQITGAYTALSLDGTSITPDANGYFTPSANGELTVTGGNGTTTCVHLKWDGERDGEYEPYEQHTYALDDVELRGIPKLDASNNLYADGDIYPPSGEVQRRYKEETFDGSNDESWTLNTTSEGNAIFQITISDSVSIVNDNNDLRTRCNKLTAYPAYPLTRSGRPTYACGLVSSNRLFVILPSASVADVTALRTWLGTNNLNVVYELDTPTTESADPYTELQICDDFGVEEFVDAATRDFEMPVGHNTVYKPNLRAKLEMAPNSPDGDGLYAVRQSGGINTYEEIIFPTELPSAPTSDGTYRLVCTVADGVATYSWTAN